MFIKELSLRNFRNVEEARLEFTDGINVLCGDNAQGKTNALEGIFLLSATKSFRHTKDADLVLFSKDEGTVSALYEEGGRDEEISTKILSSGKRSFFIDGIPCEKNNDAMGRIITVVFTPDHLSLVKESPDQRRRFLDLAICQAKPVMLSIYREYSQITAQKNAMFKYYKEKGILDKAFLSVLNEKLAKCCEIIAAARTELCGMLSDFASKIYKDMTNQREELDFIYKKSVLDEDELFDGYFELFESKADSEKEMGFCTLGVHRDDVKIKINGKSVREFASQGQQRSVVLSMKLAEGEYLSKKRGSMPIFLFDDLLSELDSNRREFILEKIKGRQVIITSCNEEFHKDAKSNVYRVENGVFTRI